SLDDKLARLAGPDVGFVIDQGYVSPSRDDSSEGGLPGGGRAVSLNGIPVPADTSWVQQLPGIRLGIGETNRLAIQHHLGEARELELAVRPLTWRDVLFAEGAIDLIAFAFFAVGLAVFLLRPWQVDTWALLVLGGTAGGVLLTFTIPLACSPNSYPHEVICSSFS